MFKLLALRVLDGCADYMKKCLHETAYYYFCTDYLLNDPNKIYKGSRYAEPLGSDFFSPIIERGSGVAQNPSVKINVNAIVGKNGDGKSTIVELIIRLVNNYIASQPRRKYSNIPELLYVDGVEAELYFLLDDRVYLLTTSKQKQVDLYEIATIKDLKNNSEIQFVQRYQKKSSVNVFKTIYTLVSNYSHYAYNIYDFQNEWKNDGNDIRKEEIQYKVFWLSRIFHKNDGYITPLSIHPYRVGGNIDVNKETMLAKQRLLYIYIKSVSEQNAFQNILGKQAVGIRLTPTTNNKLFERSIKAFFLAHREDDASLDWAIKPITENLAPVFELRNRNVNGVSEEERKNIYSKVQSAQFYFNEIQYVYDRILGGMDFSKSVRPKYIEFLKYVANELDKEYILKRGRKKSYIYRDNISSTKRYNDMVRRLYESMRRIGAKHMVPDYPQIYFTASYTGYNLSQLARLYTIFKIAIKYEIDPTILYTPFDSLTNKDKAQLYRIYKTISIFETYPQYTELVCSKDKNLGRDACFEYTSIEENDLFEQLDIDIAADSHITRKLVQTKHYVDKEQDLFDEPELEIKYTPKDAVSRIKDIKCIEHYYGRIDLSYMIPPVFDYDIVLKDGNSFMEYETLSSGEKQLLNNVGAIIYHLQNIDSADSKYQSVNLILEEIELYFHPEFQRLLIHIIIEQIYGIRWKNLKNINIMFITHSPFVLSDIPKCNVLFLDDGNPDYSMQENTFGANIHSLLKNGFFLPNLPIGEFAYRKINELFRILNDHQYKDDEIEQIKQKIALIGEPYLREQLYRLIPYYNRNAVH